MQNDSLTKPKKPILKKKLSPSPAKVSSQNSATSNSDKGQQSEKDGTSPPTNDENSQGRGASWSKARTGGSASVVRTEVLGI